VDGRGELLGEFTADDRLLIVKQDGTVKTAIPEVTMRFDDDMIILEKWDRKKPLSAIYWDGEKEVFYVKRFLIENPDKDELVISDHPKSYLEKLFTDHRPMAEVVFVKERGKDRKPNAKLNLEEFIAVKGISAQGNRLTPDKVKEINALDSLPYEEPEPVRAEEIDVVDEEAVTSEETSEEKKSPAKKDGKKDIPPANTDDEGQTTLF
jgi:topoisomerase-4 subunit A